MDLFGLLDFLYGRAGCVVGLGGELICNGSRLLIWRRKPLFYLHKLATKKPVCKLKLRN